MTDQNKSIFSFPQASSSSSTPSAPAFSFGQSPANTSNLFGSGKPPISTTSSSFGSILNQQSGNTAFGSTGAGGQGASGMGASTGTSGVGSAGGDKPQSSLFGMGTANSSGATGTSSLFGNALGGSHNKPASSLAGGAGGGMGGGQTFSGLGGSSSGVGNSASPFSLGKPSEAGPGSSLFGQTKPQNSQAQGTSGAPAIMPSSTAPAQKSLFSAGGFSTGNAGAGASSPLSGPGLTTPASIKPTFQFPTGSTTPAGPPPAKPDAASNSAPSTQQAGSTLFSGISGQSATSQPSQNILKPASATGGLFSNLGKTQSDAATTSQSQLQSDTAAKAPQPSAEPASAKTPFSGSLFPALGSSKPGASQGPSPAATTGAVASDTPKTSTISGQSLFANSNITTSSPSATATATSGPAKDGSNVVTSSASSNPAFGASSATTAGAGARPTLANSTSGPAPPPQSRLKNKSMDDIITRWATDLAKYQKEFQQQSEKIATWDRLLVENSDKISKLYIRAFQAQRDAAEVERQLATVEGQQDELSSWLDKYEKEVDEIMSRQVGQGEGMNGPDQERERTYKLAEKVSDRLTEMSQDLSSMIEEINSVSAALSKTNKPDNPLSQIVRVLNGHLSLLQQIDEGSASLQSKVAAAQKESQRMGTNGYHGIGSNPADDFYRSFVGGRR